MFSYCAPCAAEERISKSRMWVIGCKYGRTKANTRAWKDDKHCKAICSTAIIKLKPKCNVTVWLCSSPKHEQHLSNPLQNHVAPLSLETDADVKYLIYVSVEGRWGTKRSCNCWTQSQFSGCHYISGLMSKSCVCVVYMLCVDTFSSKLSPCIFLGFCLVLQRGVWCDNLVLELKIQSVSFKFKCLNSQNLRTQLSWFIWKEPVKVFGGSDQDASWVRCFRHVLHWRGPRPDTGQAGGISFLSLLGNDSASPWKRRKRSWLSGHLCLYWSPRDLNTEQRQKMDWCVCGWAGFIC